MTTPERCEKHDWKKTWSTSTATGYKCTKCPATKQEPTGLGDVTKRYK